MKRSLVTGGSGFCGQAVVKELLEQGHEVVIFDAVAPKTSLGIEFVSGSIIDRSRLETTMSGVDSVYHVAGQLGTHELFNSLHAAIDTNIHGTVSALQAAQDAKVKNFMYPTKPYAWCNAYTVTKQCGEEFVKMFGQVYGMNVSILRWLNVYGPGQKIVPVRKAIPLMCVQAIEGYPIEIYGSGDAVVDLVYTDDMARVTVAYTEREKTEVIKRDVGCVTRMTVNTLAKEIKTQTGGWSEIKHIPMRMGEDSDDPKEALLVGSARRAMCMELGSVMTPFVEGMRRTIEYYREEVSQASRMEALGFYKCQRS